jgi:serine/threonine-protein kinase
MAVESWVQELLGDICNSGCSPEEVCADCPELLPEVRRRWLGMCALKADLHALFPTPRPDPGPGADSPVPWHTDAELPQIPGYEVEALIGRGGMGLVYKARQVRLNRFVALKMLITGAYAGPHERARFQREAEAVASLRHAHIVQIHDVGDHQGWPYFTMELLERGSLAQALSGTPQPACQAAALVATLAEAMEAAHRGGIVHRDLKPANILLTAEGTPKVADFGLARHLEGEPVLTQSGARMGTLSYMAPEQVIGKTDAIGPATDIYALGAVLYEMLTGRPPFRGETASESERQVLTHEPVSPSRLNPRVARDLETICLKCLQKDPGKRYSTAAELAADIERFLKHEPIQARPIGPLEHGVRWIRRRPAAAGLLAALVLVVATGTLGAWSLHRQRTIARSRQVKTDLEVRGVVERARGLLEDGWRADDAAKLAEARAEGSHAADIARSGGASAMVQRETARFQQETVERVERAKLNHALMEAILDVLIPYERSAYAYDEAGRLIASMQSNLNDQYADAFSRWGLDVDTAEEDEIAERLLRQPAVVVQEVIAAFDSWMVDRWQRNRPEAEWSRLRRVADRLDSSDQRRRLRGILVGGSLPRAETAAGPVTVGPPGNAPAELQRASARRQLLEVAQHLDPAKEPVLTVVLLAQACAAAGDFAGAERVLRQASTVRPDHVVLLNALGNLLQRQSPSRIDEAIEFFRAARALRPRLGIALGSALARAGRAEEGEQVLRDLMHRHPECSVLYNEIGMIAYDLRKYGEAQSAFSKAIDLNPGSGAAHHNLGNSLLAQGKFGEAEPAYRKAIELRPEFAWAHNNLGIALLQRGRHVQAEATIRKAIDLEPNCAEAYINLGTALSAQRKVIAAEAAYRKAIELKSDLAAAYCNLGITLRFQGRHVEAEAAFRKAIERDPKDTKSYFNLGDALDDLGRKAEAEAVFRKTTELKPDYAQAHNNLACVLNDLHKHGEAEAASRKAIDLMPDLAEAHYALGYALSGQGKHGEALSAYRKVIDLRPNFAEAYVNLGNSLLAQGKFGEAEAACREAIAVKSDLAEAYNMLGVALMQQARFQDAAASLKKAADLLPGGAPLRERASQRLQGCKRLAILDARLPTILKGTEKSADAAEQIEFARLCILKRLPAAAARFFADAFASQPQLAEEPASGDRYNAACSAALAGCGRAMDRSELGDAERAKWRLQARQWLRADLDAWEKKLEKRPVADRGKVRGALAHWRTDSDLAGLREPSAVETLPVDERKECRALWQDVDNLLERCREAK